MHTSEAPEKVQKKIEFSGSDIYMERAESSSEHYGTVNLTELHSGLLHDHSLSLAAAGGPQEKGADILAKAAAIELLKLMTIAQKNLIDAYADGLLSYLIFADMKPVNSGETPAKLDSLEMMERNENVLYLAARNHILLEIAGNRAFAYDIDNNGKVVRVVANYKGGGSDALDDEPAGVELSSHSGLGLGPHTEAPYWCSFASENGHSPAPSTLILSALWNPLHEPTTIIPVAPVLQEIGVINSLALTTKSFGFTRSDSFVDAKGEDGKCVSILDYNQDYGFAARYNFYRFSVDDDASTSVKTAYSAFVSAVGSAHLERVVLDQTNAVLINNYRSLHCRDVIKDNRRLLVRLFGYSKKATPIILDHSPLIVKG